MHTRLISLAAAALAATVVFAAGQPDRPRPDGQPDKGKAGGAGAGVSLDGEWTVVSAAREGSAVTGADKMTVTIKGNVVTFGGTGAGAGADDKSKMRALRLDFGPNGTVRVAEAGTDGKFGTGGTGGTGGDKGGTGTTPPTGGDKGGTGTIPGGTGGTGGTIGTTGTMSGVYVATQDFLAISVFASGTGTGGTGTGGTGTGGTGTGGTGTNPGGTGTTPPAGGTTPPTGGTATPGGAGAGAGLGAGPQMRTHMSVILKRGGGTRP
jgi:hypothetical protein